MAIAIAAVYALIGFIPLARRALARPLLWVCLIAGVIAGFFAREAVNLAAEALAPVSALASGPASVVVTLLIAAAVGELLKVLARWPRW
jgi:type III secretory pathway component EscT